MRKIGLAFLLSLLAACSGGSSDGSNGDASELVETVDAVISRDGAAGELPEVHTGDKTHQETAESCDNCLDEDGEIPCEGDECLDVHQDEAVADFCGDEKCGAGEDCDSCPYDCGSCCGNEICDFEESCGTCPFDCGSCLPHCGDGTVQEGIGEQCDDGGGEPADGCDENCQVEPLPAPPGSIIIAEIMKDPIKTNDSVGEWFELYNASAADIDLNGWTVEDLGIDVQELFSFEGVVIPAKSYFVLARSGDPAENGGVEADYVYSKMHLGNYGDEVILKAGDVVIDQVIYDWDLFPKAQGRALSLDPAAMTAELNDHAANWCEAEYAHGDGDYGSPGLENPQCPLPPECGDGECNGDEVCNICLTDCGQCCGNGACEPDHWETCGTCPLDCGICCGNGDCDFDETCDDCPADCGTCCGNGECDFEETCDACPVDCGVCCGNGKCDFEETCDDCPGDCGDCCGNGVCDFGENCLVCEEDCGDCCGDEFCDGADGESCETCPSDCFGCCGNLECQGDLGEDCITCLADCGFCPATCGNGSIESGEACDDGNEEAGDGCGASCLLEFPSDLEPGMLVITEIMKDPELVHDVHGEWVEIMNVGAVAHDINDWTLKDADSDVHVIDAGGPLMVGPGDTVVLGNDADQGANGGVELLYQYSAFNLANDADEVILVAPDGSPEGLLMDWVIYNDSDFPATPGKAMSLGPEASNQTDNDEGGNWCDAVLEMPGGDFGSPGSPNPSCSALAGCGNGVQEPGEGCDDGNNADGDGCGALCEAEDEALCGNGLIEGPGSTWPEGTPSAFGAGSEWCDDGNVEDGDGCSAECLWEGFEPWICGNGIAEHYADEQCDDGNVDNEDGCNEWCKIEGTGLCAPMPCCGDGYTTEDEQCDDGNLVKGDGCSELCTYEVSDSYISGTVTYDGEPDDQDTVWIMVYSEPEDDPMNLSGEPEFANQYPASALYAPIEFPLEYGLTVDKGIYYLAVVMDLGGDDEEDFGVMYEVDGEVAAIVVGENQAVTGIDVALTKPEGPELGSISGVVSFTGDTTLDDSLVIHLSSIPLPDMDIQKEQKYKPVEFPVSYIVPNVTPGAYYVIAAFDENDDMQVSGPGEGDILINYVDADNPVQVIVGSGEDVVDIDIDLGP